MTDAGVGVVLGTCTPAVPATLAPGASQVCAATHTVTQSDIDAGTYTNVAVGDSNQTDPDTDEETTPITQHPALTVDQDGDLDRSVRGNRGRHQLFDHRHEHRQPDAHRREHHGCRSRSDPARCGTFGGCVHAGDPGDADAGRLGRLLGDPHRDPGRHRRGHVPQRRDRRLRPDPTRHRRRDGADYAGPEPEPRQDGHLNGPVRRGRRRDHLLDHGHKHGQPDAHRGHGHRPQRRAWRVHARYPRDGRAGRLRSSAPRATRSPRPTSTREPTATSRSATPTRQPPETAT